MLENLPIDLLQLIMDQIDDDQVMYNPTIAYFKVKCCDRRPDATSLLLHLMRGGNL